MILIAAICAGFHYEADIQQYWPEFEAMLFSSGIICGTGLTYAVIMRNPFIAVLMIIGAVAAPALIQSFIFYWPVASAHLTDFLNQGFCE